MPHGRLECVAPGQESSLRLPFPTARRVATAPDRLRAQQREITDDPKEEVHMEIISVGTEWSHNVKCGSCQSALKVGPGDLGWFKKTNWVKGSLGFRCGHCRTVILFDSDLTDGKNRE